MLPAPRIVSILDSIEYRDTFARYLSWKKFQVSPNLQTDLKVKANFVKLKCRDQQGPDLQEYIEEYQAKVGKTYAKLVQKLRKAWDSLLLTSLFVQFYHYGE